MIANFAHQLQNHPFVLRGKKKILVPLKIFVVAIATEVCLQSAPGHKKSPASWFSWLVAASFPGLYVASFGRYPTASPRPNRGRAQVAPQQ